MPLLVGKEIKEYVNLNLNLERAPTADFWKLIFPWCPFVNALTHLTWMDSTVISFSISHGFSVIFICFHNYLLVLNDLFKTRQFINPFVYYKKKLLIFCMNLTCVVANESTILTKYFCWDSTLHI